MALTKKRPTAMVPEKTITAKAAPAVVKKTAQPASAKPAPQHPSVPPCNPRHILEVEATDASGSSDNDIYGDPAPEPITINDLDNSVDIEEVPKAPEESAEAELSMWHYSCIRS